MLDKEDRKHRIINELQHMLNLSEDAALGLDVTQKIRASIEQIALELQHIMNLSEDAALGLDVAQKIRASIEQIALDVRRL